MDIKHRIQRFLKFRFLIMYPFAVYLAFFANSDDQSILQGSGFLLTGLLLRMWANGYAIKNDKLTTSGPYSYVRHPLSLGSTLIVIGFIIILKIYLIGVVFLPLFLFAYLKTMRSEEGMLIAKFGQHYIDYKQSVHGLWPRLTAYRAGDKWAFSLSRLLKSQEYKLFIWTIIIVIAFHLKDELFVEREAIDAKIIILIASALVLALLDVIGEFFRKSEWGMNYLANSR